MRLLQFWACVGLLLSVGCGANSGDGGSAANAQGSAEECGAQRPCGAGESCVGGKCQAAPLLLTPGNGESAGTAGQSGGVCVNLDVAFENRKPTVLLLVDQSGSMFDQHYPLGAQTTRWSVLRDALMLATTGAVKQVESSVRLGLALYSAHADPQDLTCPRLARVPIALDNHAAIDAAYQAASRGEDTPTGDSLNAVVPSLAVEPDPKYILLVTDGEPDTCADPNPATPEGRAAAQALSIKAVQDAYAAKIGVLVMAVAKDIAPEHVQALANAGAGKPPATAGLEAARYYVASDSPTELSAQLKGILAGVRTCSFTLSGKVAEGRAADGTIVLDGASLAFNDPNGYRLNSPSELEILGTACDAIKADSQALSVSFPCGSFEPK